MSTHRDVERLSAVVLDSLDDEGGSETLARAARVSRTQFFRISRAVIDETPAAMRRRLLLERAAWQLARTQQSVTHIALDAGYGSLEAFTRAFRKAFRISPSMYRRMGATHYHLPSSTSIHFCAPTSRSRGDDMDLYDIFAGAESFHTQTARARTGADARAARCPIEQQDLRVSLGLAGRESPRFAAPDCADEGDLDSGTDRRHVFRSQSGTARAGTPDVLLARLKKVDVEFNRVLHDVRNRNAWGDTFVDALCEPPETFTFGGMFAHVVTFNGYQRLLAPRRAATNGRQGRGIRLPDGIRGKSYIDALNS